MSIYAYDFQTCGHAVIDHVRAAIDSQREWDFSSSEKEARANSREAAKRFGINKILNDEHKALSKYLIAKRAGLHIATYAWGTYIDLLSSASPKIGRTKSYA
jgi:hypothetical protein